MSADLLVDREIFFTCGSAVTAINSALPRGTQLGGPIPEDPALDDVTIYLLQLSDGSVIVGSSQVKDMSIPSDGRDLARADAYAKLEARRVYG